MLIFAANLAAGRRKDSWPYRRRRNFAITCEERRASFRERKSARRLCFIRQGRGRYRRQLAQNCKKIFPDRARPRRTRHRPRCERVCGGRTTIAPKYTRAKSEANYKHAASHRAVSHQSAEYFSLGQLNNSTRRRTARPARRVRECRDRVLMCICRSPGAFSGGNR